jgi:hypothetical protein
MILEDHPDWDVTAGEVMALPNVDEAGISAHFAAARSASVVIAQPIGAYRGISALSLDALRDSLPGNIPLITFPSIFFAGTHGAFQYLNHAMSGYCMHYNNVHSIEMFLRNYRWEDICKLQMSRDFYPASFIDTTFAASLAELQYREEHQGTTIRVSETIRDYGRSILLMHTINHPNRFLLARTLNAIYRALSLAPLAKEHGEDYLGQCILPPLPTVLAHMGLQDHAAEVEVPGRRWTREGYLRESLAYYAGMVQSELTRAFTGSAGAAFLRSLHGAPMPVSDLQVDAGRVAGQADMLRSLVFGTFQTLLHRAPSQTELQDHSAQIATLGVHGWLEAIVAAEEFSWHYRRVGAVA